MEAEELKKRAQALQPALSALRRDLHRHPELGGQEERTCGVILRELERMGIACRRLGNTTAVVGLIEGGAPGPGPGRTVAIRADMDALPIEEAADGAPYRSEVPGVMHACGHDAHVAVLLGAARLLHGLRGSFHGRVKLLFQPAEETTGGAEPMMRMGCMEDPKVDCCIGLHVSEGLPAGVVELCYGAVNGASDMLDITVRGRKAHGAHPEGGCDAVVAAAHLITALQTVASRNVSPTDSLVLSIGAVHGGSARNVIADEVKMNAILRTIDPETRVLARRRIEEIASGVCGALGAGAQLRFMPGYKALINSAPVVDVLRRAAREAVGDGNIRWQRKPSLGVDDFAFFLDACPGAYYHLGCAQPGHENERPAHSSTFDVDESCLPVGALMHTLAALRLLAGDAERPADGPRGENEG